MSAELEIAVALFPRVTALDAVGPYEVLQRLPGATVTFVGEARGEVRTENGFLGLTVDATFDEVTSPDVVLVPGGIGTRALLDAHPAQPRDRRRGAGRRPSRGPAHGARPAAGDHRRRRPRHLPVVDGDRVVGLVEQTDPNVGLHYRGRRPIPDPAGAPELLEGRRRSLSS